MSSKARENRKMHYDLLRILAAFSVVMLHSAAQFWYTLDIYSTEWLIANSYDAVFRFGVPIFVMISGALFLGKDYRLDIPRLYRHNILRLLIMYMIWSCLYGLWDCAVFNFLQNGWKAVLRAMLAGRYHLWFLPMLIGIYMLLPILKSWVEHAEKKNIQYFLCLFLVFQVGAETLRALTVTDELHAVLDIWDIEMACSYIGYFVLGYYLAHFEISHTLKKGIYCCALPAVLGNIVLGNYLARKAGVATGAIYDSFGAFTFVIAVALFLLVREKAGKIQFGEKDVQRISELAGDTLGVYLLHIGVIEGLKLCGIHSMLLPNIIGIPIYATGCFVLCLVAAAVLRRIPVIGRYIC